MYTGNVQLYSPTRRPSDSILNFLILWIFRNWLFFHINWTPWILTLSYRPCIWCSISAIFSHVEWFLLELEYHAFLCAGQSISMYALWHVMLAAWLRICAYHTSADASALHLATSRMVDVDHIRRYIVEWMFCIYSSIFRSCHVVFLLS